ncbi:MAG TPA: hypothetical protein VFC15_00120 [Candidatus Limnocylindrales bacterium]|nr:hypothetical protein [Candidatus Limnocylindrales bacterium]HZM08599.1 hypothetical protein [Candidatus Limnocylindrales bacterium]
MKHNTYGALTMLAVALMISVPTLQAQSRVRADVPFAFSLEQTSMPAGGYEVSSIEDKVLAVRNLGTGQARLLIASMHVEVSQASGTPHAKLVFNKYGDQYFLSQIWDGQSQSGIALSESKREKELKMASTNLSGPETVIIAMK